MGQQCRSRTPFVMRGIRQRHCGLGEQQAAYGYGWQPANGRAQVIESFPEIQYEPHENYAAGQFDKNAIAAVATGRAPQKRRHHCDNAQPADGRVFFRQRNTNQSCDETEAEPATVDGKFTESFRLEENQNGPKQSFYDSLWAPAWIEYV